jgi:hypothetical protein
VKGFEMRLLSGLVAVAVILCAATPERAAALTPPLPPMDGTYRVQPGAAVLACGGIIGQCKTLQIEGSIELDATFANVRIARTDLKLRDDEPRDFPSAGDLALTGLEGAIENEGDTQLVRLEAEGQFGQRVALELVSVGVVPSLVGNLRLALRGTYDEGCCDRYVYDFGNVRLEPDFLEGLELGEQEYARFVVNIFWSAGFAEHSAVPARLGSNHGYFWFYTPDNPEIFVKIVSACATPFQNVWFFASGLTNLKVRIEVVDRFTGQAKTYLNPAGVAFAPIQDTVGFPCQSLP